MHIFLRSFNIFLKILEVSIVYLLNLSIFDLFVAIFSYFEQYKSDVYMLGFFWYSNLLVHTTESCKLPFVT